MKDKMRELMDSSDRIPSLDLIDVAEEKGWISIRHANLIRNNWRDETKPFVAEAESAKAIVLEIRENIINGYLSEIQKNGA